MAQEVPLDPMGDEWAGYRAIVTGVFHVFWDRWKEELHVNGGQETDITPQ